MDDQLKDFATKYMAICDAVDVKKREVKQLGQECESLGGELLRLMLGEGIRAFGVDDREVIVEDKLSVSCSNTKRAVELLIRSGLHDYLSVSTNSVKSLISEGTADSILPADISGLFASSVSQELKIRKISLKRARSAEKREDGEV